MDAITKTNRKGLKQPGVALVLGLIGHIKDPETGERMVDSAEFKALVDRYTKKAKAA